MNHPKLKIIAGLQCLLFLAACSAPEEARQEVQLSERCSEPRPEMCTFQYDPVCALEERDGEQRWATHSNGCVACSEPQVIGHRPGACEEAAQLAP